MEREEIFHKTGLAIADFFKLKNFIFQESTTAADIEAWNSFSHLPLMAKIEEDFGVTFSFMEITDFNTVGDIIHCIHKKLSEV